MTKLLLPFVFLSALAFWPTTVGAQRWTDPQAHEANNHFCEGDLDSLSTEELIALYAAEYENTLRSRTAADAFLAPHSHLTLQVGYSFTLDEDDLDYRYTTHTLPRLLLRYRANDWLELRTGWSGATLDTITDRNTGASDRETFVADPSFGARISLSGQSGIRPRTALTLSTPVELNDTTDLANRFNPLATLAYTWVVSDMALLSGSSGAAWVTDGVERYLDFQQSVSIDYVLTDRLDVYCEWFGVFADGSTFRHFAGPGVSYCFSRRLQAGWNVSFGLNESSTSLLTGVDLTYRF